MTEKRARPAWWKLYLLGLGIAGLLAWGAASPLSQGGHEAAAIGTVLLAWVLVEAWLRANRPAMMHIEGLTLVERSAPEAPAEEPQPALFAGQRAPESQNAVTLPGSDTRRREGVRS